MIAGIIGNAIQVTSGNLDLLSSPDNFPLNENIENPIYYTVGITYDEKDPYFSSDINSSYATGIPKIRKYKFLDCIIETIDKSGNFSTSAVSIGKTDMYEITQPIPLRTITFPNGVPQSIQINICSYSKEEE